MRKLSRNLGFASLLLIGLMTHASAAQINFTGPSSGSNAQRITLDVSINKTVNEQVSGTFSNTTACVRSIVSGSACTATSASCPGLAIDFAGIGAGVADCRVEYAIVTGTNAPGNYPFTTPVGTCLANSVATPCDIQGSVTLQADPVTNNVTPAPGPLRYNPNGTPATAREISIPVNAQQRFDCALLGASNTAAFSQLPISRSTSVGLGATQTLRYQLNHCIPQATETTAEIFCREGPAGNTNVINGTGQSFRWPLTCPAIQLSSILPDRRLCRVEEIPAGLQFGVSGISEESSGGTVSLDGRYVLFTRNDPANTRIDPRTESRVQEVVALDRTTRQVIPITQNSEQTYDIASWRTNGNLVLRSRANYRFRDVNGQQVLEILAGRDLPRLIISGLPNVAVANAPEPAQISNEGAVDSADGTTSLAYNAIFSGSPRELFKLQITNRVSGEIVNLAEQIRIAAGLPNALSTVDFLGSFPLLSGDGQRVSFASSLVLLGTNLGQRSRDLTGLPVSRQNYIFDRTSQTLFEPASVNRALTVPNLPPNLFFSAFTRRLGRTGSVVAIDPRMPLIGTSGNTDLTSEVYFADLSGSLTQLTNSGAGPANTRFNSSLAFITFDENAVLFKSFEDLAGNNPDKEPQLFRYDIASKQIRQVTANRGNFAAVARQLNLDAEAGFDDNPANDQSALNSFAGAVASGQSANGSVLLVSEFARTTAQANSTGIQIGRNQTVTTLYVCE